MRKITFFNILFANKILFSLIRDQIASAKHCSAYESRPAVAHCESLRALCVCMYFLNRNSVFDSYSYHGDIIAAATRI